MKYETDRAKRQVIHTALISANPKWVERLFRWAMVNAPMPAPAITQEQPLFREPDPRVVSRGKVFLGLTPRGTPVRLNDDVWGRKGHVMISGTTGTGKTTLLTYLAYQLYQFVPVQIFDTLNKFAKVSTRFAPAPFVLPFHQYRRNIFSPPACCNSATWIQIVLNYLRNDFEVENVATNVLAQVCSDLQDSGVALTIPNIVQQLQNTKYRSASQRALLNRLLGLLQATGPVFAAQVGVDPDRILKSSSIFILNQVAGQPLKIFYDDLYAWIAQSRQSNLDGHLRNIWIFDESHTLFSKLTAEALALQMFRQGRNYGICFICGDQIPSYEHPVVRGNIGLQIIFRLRDWDAAMMYGSLMGLSQAQRHALMNLPSRTALVHHPDVAYPFLVQVPELHFERSSERDLEKRIQETIQELQIGDEPVIQRLALPSSPPPERELSHEAQIYLMDIAKELFVSATERDKRFGFSGYKGDKIRKELKSEGLVKEASVTTYKRGGEFLVFPLTEKGQDYLKARAVPYEPPKGKGNWQHRFCQHSIAKKLVEAGHKAEIEARRVSKQVDVGANIDGQWVAFEVVMSQPEKEVTNLAKDLEDGWDCIVFCCDKPSTVNRLKKLLDPVPPKVEVRLLSSFF
ncbi:hypothetical protein MYX77_05325 [Acidobacteriia bacterium AH_259_A11_L15]|nr:hypothetical protein [Acidobacteriia bacterium AH_259_A11_L15]